MARGRRYYRDYDRPGGLVQLGRLLVAAAIMLALIAGGLTYYASTLTPERHPVQKVLPDERFPR